MEFVRISKSKIKVIITKQECHRYELIAKDGEYDSSALRNSLPEIFKEVRKNVNFNFASEKVLIQLYPTEDGGCELYATILDYLSNKDKSALLSANNLNTYEKKRCQYHFDTLSDVICALNKIKREGIDSDLFYDTYTGYYLSVCDEVIDGQGELTYLAEYANSVPLLPRAYLVEHYIPLALGNAIDVFGKM